MQTLWQVPHCLVYAEWLSAVDLTADFLNTAHRFVRVTDNNGFLTKSLFTKRLHAQFVVVGHFFHW